MLAAFFLFPHRRRLNRDPTRRTVYGYDILSARIRRIDFLIGLVAVKLSVPTPARLVIGKRGYKRITTALIVVNVLLCSQVVVRSGLCADCDLPSVYCVSSPVERMNIDAICITISTAYDMSIRVISVFNVVLTLYIVLSPSA